ncbi:BACON domain-containing protein [Streptomyces sp. NBC_01465]|uniref:BACON domain-containing protein n=1 Tax=Streptomyces sp. NBC_01465 TaxID=2903878 RepID=UPI002E322E49|nr:hypothetical protein [Streptomyces sp. NBC_01465]
MTSSRLEHPTHTTGAHRAQRRAPGQATRIQRPPARYEAYLDGLFTYCLSVLCDHDAATAVLGDVLALSERQFSRSPSADPQRRAWLYALARWACLRKLAELKRSRPGAHTGRTTGPAPSVPQETADSRHRELALLAWPEAAGTTPEQREALELAVRHRLAPAEVAAVLGMDSASARALLAAAACEVERTRAALAVVETGSCSSVARLTGDRRVLLSPALRRELVRHVDDCPRCRRAAERAGAAGPWPGSVLSTGSPAELPLVAAPRQAAYVAMLHAPRSNAPRFGRNGFPLDPKDHAARRDRLRARAVTTTVVATVVAAPVLALWAAYRGAPFTGEGHDGSRVTASETDGQGGLNSSPYDHYENAGNARTDPSPGFTAGSRAPDVSVEVISPGAAAGPKAPGAGRLTVEAQSSGETTTITLTNAGGAPVHWSAWTDADWLRFSSTSGTLAPGGTFTIQVYVNHHRDPEGDWTARIGIDPTGAVVSVSGHGRPHHHRPPTDDPTPPTQGPTPTPTDSASPTPTDSPTPTPTDSTSPSPTETATPLPAN